VSQLGAKERLGRLPMGSSYLAATTKILEQTKVINYFRYSKCARGS
jgi:hypothetical protein